MMVSRSSFSPTGSSLPSLHLTSSSQRRAGGTSVLVVCLLVTSHPASRVTLWVSHGKFASRTSFQGGLLFSSGGPFFSFRGASFFGMKNGNLHSGGHWPPWKRIASYQVNLWSELIVKLFFIIMQQRLDWILKFVFLSARFDNMLRMLYLHVWS